MGSIRLRRAVCESSSRDVCYLYCPIVLLWYDIRLLVFADSHTQLWTSIEYPVSDIHAIGLDGLALCGGFLRAGLSGAQSQCFHNSICYTPE